MTLLIAHFDTGRDYTLHLTITHTVLFKVKSSLPLLDSCPLRRTIPFCVTDPSPLGYELLTAVFTTTEPQRLSN
jgi:hypothetical protein